MVILSMLATVCAAAAGQPLLLTSFEGEDTLGQRWLWHAPQTWYLVTIRAVGPVIECYVDGRRRLRVEDPTLKSGSIGLGGWENEALFDDITVNAITGYRPLLVRGEARAIRARTT